MSYEFHKVGQSTAYNKKYLVNVITYNFRSPKHLYLVEIEQYRDKTFIIKYFLKKHKKNKHKYNLLSKEFKCRQVVLTVINILYEVLSKHKCCNFGFMGANTTDHSGKELESKDNTKRYRVYRKLVEDRVGPDTFTHYMSDKGSYYLLVHNKHVDVTKVKDQIVEMFRDEFPQLGLLNVICSN